MRERERILFQIIAENARAAEFPLLAFLLRRAPFRVIRKENDNE